MREKFERKVREKKFLGTRIIATVTISRKFNATISRKEKFLGTQGNFCTVEAVAVAPHRPHYCYCYYFYL
jgi:hypothetical protein